MSYKTAKESSTIQVFLSSIKKLKAVDQFSPSRPSLIELVILDFIVVANALGF